MGSWSPSGESWACFDPERSNASKISPGGCTSVNGLMCSTLVFLHVCRMKMSAQRLASNRTSPQSPSNSDYTWEYEYYEIGPVSFEGLKAHKCKACAAPLGNCQLFALTCGVPCDCFSLTPCLLTEYSAISKYEGGMIWGHW